MNKIFLFICLKYMNIIWSWSPITLWKDIVSGLASVWIFAVSCFGLIIVVIWANLQERIEKSQGIWANNYILLKRGFWAQMYDVNSSPKPDAILIISLIIVVDVILALVYSTWWCNRGLSFTVLVSSIVVIIFGGCLLFNQGFKGHLALPFLLVAAGGLFNLYLTISYLYFILILNISSCLLVFIVDMIRS